MYSFADNPKVFFRPPGRVRGVYGSMVMLHAQLCLALSASTDINRPLSFLEPFMVTVVSVARSNSKDVAKIVLKDTKRIPDLSCCIKANFKINSAEEDRY